MWTNQVSSASAGITFPTPALKISATRSPSPNIMPSEVREAIVYVGSGTFLEMNLNTTLPRCGTSGDVSLKSCLRKGDLG